MRGLIFGGSATDKCIAANLRVHIYASARLDWSGLRNMKAAFLECGTDNPVGGLLAWAGLPSCHLGDLRGACASFGDSPAEACTRAKRSPRSSLASDRAPSQLKASILEVRLNYGCFFPALFSVSQRLALFLR